MTIANHRTLTWILISSLKLKVNKPYVCFYPTIIFVEVLILHNKHYSIILRVHSWVAFVSYLSAYSHPYCSAALCPDPVDIDNGMVTFTGNSAGDTATYSCDPGFELIGGATTTCTLVDANLAVFSPQPPFCSREYCMNLTRVATCLLELY